MSAKLELVDYSERSVAVFGDTKAYLDELKEIGGKFNSSLTHPGTKTKTPGWIFQKSKKSELAKLLNKSVTSPKPVPLETTVSRTNLTSYSYSKSDKSGLALTMIRKLIADKEKELTDLKSWLCKFESNNEEDKEDKVEKKSVNIVRKKEVEKEVNYEDGDGEEVYIPRVRLLGKR